MKKVMDTHFVTIQGWMRTKLGLKGNRLVIYALIYGFSQDGESKFEGSIKYIEEWTGASRSTVIRVLNELCQEQKIGKISTEKRGVILNDYYAILPTQQDEQGGVKMKRGGCQNETGGGVKMKPHIYSLDNIEENDNSDNIEEKSKSGKFENLPSYEEYQEGSFFLDDEQAAEIVLRFFVSHTGKNISVGEQKGADSNRKLVKKWLKKKYSIVELCQVIEMKKAEWEFDLEMSKYIRLSTLFNRKFIGYVQDLINLQQNPSEAEKFKLEIKEKKRRYERRFGKVGAGEPIVEQESVEDWFKN